MKFKHRSWRKLYRDEEGAFAMLPFTARAYGAELLKMCDDAGRIECGAKPLVDVVAFRMGATRGDRRMMAMMFPLLFAEGYLVQRGTVVVVRNFVAAQRRWDDEEVSPSPTPDNEAATTEQPSSNEVTTTEQRTGNEAATKSPRPSNEAATKSPRPSNEAATKPELSARKHEDEIASARARALSLDLSREDKSTSKKDRDVEQPPSGSPPAPPAVLTLSDSKSNSPKPDSAISEVRKLFAHWQSVMEHPRSVLDPKRERLLQQSIARHGFEDCWRAIDGCKADPWHQGANDRGTRFDGLELIFRDVAHVEKFVGYLDPSRAKFVDPRKGIAPAAPASAFAEATAARKGISRDIFGEHLARKASNQ